MSTALQARLEAAPVLLADGATGTNLFAMGLASGEAPEAWNHEHPDRVRRLHADFVAAGSDIVLTNSFGANRYRLALHGAGDRVGELNERAAALAREVADRAPRPVLVAGSMGPTGEILAPVGALAPEAAREAFAAQAEALARGGVDVLWIETMSSREEAEAAIAAAAGTGLPVVCTLSFDTNGRTMMGIAPDEFAEICRRIPTPPHAFGTNCGLGPAEAIAGLLRFAAVLRPDEVLVAKANCGVPAWVDGAVRYDGTPELMARYATLARDCGARIIGGCCGTTAAHVAAMRDALEREPRRAPPDLESVVAVLGAVSEGARGAGPARARRAGRRAGRRGGSG